jgi:antitoxin (DNA-binding transcriptional repressor) of toxin-antitoxin stability system
MKKTNISYLKEQLSSCLQQVKEGEEYLVLDRKTPVTILKPYTITDSDSTREQLIREGILKPAPRSLKTYKLPTPLKVKGTPPSQVILEEREGR